MANTFPGPVPLMPNRSCVVGDAIDRQLVHGRTVRVPVDKQVGMVEVPQEAFLAVLNIGQGQKS